MRLFIAIEFSGEIKKYLSEVCAELKKGVRSGNFTPEENFHLTLRFIGEAGKDDAELIKEALLETAVRNRSFEAELSELGMFRRDESFLLWAGIKENEKLSRLFAILEKSLQNQGFKRERKGLSPHITLAREVRLFYDFETLSKKAAIEPRKIEVSKLSLMESLRIGPRLVYRPVFTVPLAKNGKEK